MKVRALTFRKRFADFNSQRIGWATLGHTDEMVCSELKYMSLLDINRFNNKTFPQDSANVYHHVVYLIDSETDENNQVPDNVLWDYDGFLSITRIHFPDTTALQEQFNKLNSHFAELRKESETHQQICWRTYYATELSDMVLVSKSVSFQALSRWSLLATKCEQVGKAYTYFCVPGYMLNTDPENLPSSLAEDLIDFTAVRFVTRDCNAEYALLDAWKTLGEDCATPPFRVAGNEDAIICRQNIPVLNLITLYRKWYQDNSVFSVFRDISTRIGADWNVDIKERQYPDRRITKIEALSQLVLNKVREQVLVNRVHGISPESREWVRPLVELTNALVHMSSSATLDESVFQILPGLNTFWDNVIDASNTLGDEPLYLHFAELCVHTMEHLMRAEGQLSQRLEVRPLAYDIPVFVLEYVTTFLLTLSKEMTKPDGSDAEKISFLLVPSAVKDVSTVEPFRANGETPGLLLITVPFSLLYKPRQLIPALCHEIAHYVGEKLRMRELRYNLFLKCATKELITYFFEDISGDVTKLKTYINEVFFDHYLRLGSEDLVETYGTFTKIPLLKVLGNIYKLTQVLVDTEAYADLVRRYVLSDLRGARFNSIPKQTREEQMSKFAARMRDLSISFRETYADICMVYFLRLTPKEYLDLILHHDEKVGSSSLLRVYVTLYAMGNTLGEIQNAVDQWRTSEQSDPEDRERIRSELGIISERIHCSEETSEQLLATYIVRCLESLKEECPYVEGKTEDFFCTAYGIYNKIINLDSASYPEILKVIDVGRQIALAQLEKVLPLQ